MTENQASRVSTLPPTPTTPSIVSPSLEPVQVPPLDLDMPPVNLGTLSVFELRDMLGLSGTNIALDWDPSELASLVEQFDGRLLHDL